MSVVIRRAESHDSRMLIHLRKTLSEEGTYLPYSDEDVIDDYRILKHGGAKWHYQLLEKNKEVIGFLLLQCNNTFIGYVSLGILPEHRRQGYASTLLDKAIGLAIDSGFAILTLYVAITNEKAINLYHKYGFEIKAEEEVADDYSLCYKMVLEL